MAKQPATPAVACMLFMAVFLGISGIHVYVTVFPCEIWLLGRSRLPSLQRTGRAAVAVAARPACSHSPGTGPGSLPTCLMLGGEEVVGWGGLHGGQRDAPLLPNPCPGYQRWVQEGNSHSPLLGFALCCGATMGTAVHPPGETKPGDLSQEGTQCFSASRHSVHGASERS